MLTNKKKNLSKTVHGKNSVVKKELHAKVNNDVLIQKLGHKLYAFTLSKGEVLWGELSA